MLQNNIPMVDSTHQWRTPEMASAYSCRLDFDLVGTELRVVRENLLFAEAR
jgi:hypothetical protein